MAQLQGNLLKDIIHLSAATRIERFAAGDARKFIEGTLAFHPERAADVTAAENRSEA